MMITKRIESEVLDVLANLAWIDGGCVIQGTLDRTLYTKVNKLLESCGGKWSRKEKKHVFDLDAESAILELVQSGEWVDEKKSYQFFETPAAVTHQMIGILDEIKYMRGSDYVVLEPSAGHGAIARVVEDTIRCAMKCVELNPASCRILKDNGYDVVESDFLSYAPMGHIDAVVMNPPFSRLQDCDHVQHAYKQLMPGGVVVSVMSVSWQFHSSRKASQFRDWLSEVGGEVHEVHDGAFRESGTNVRTCIVSIKKG